jgi:sigma-E factor negative regulatory protein RseA
MELLMDTHKKIREHISALSDGELSPADLELAFAALQSADGQLAWNSYFRIGDVLRAQATPELSDHFDAALASRLDAEPLPIRRAPVVPLDDPAPAASPGAADAGVSAVEASPSGSRST